MTTYTYSSNTSTTSATLPLWISTVYPASAFGTLSITVPMRIKCSLCNEEYLEDMLSKIVFNKETIYLCDKCLKRVFDERTLKKLSRLSTLLSI